jgi:hexosaminidase
VYVSSVRLSRSTHGMVLALLLTLTHALPMPYPLPANFTFGACGFDPNVELPGCSSVLPLAPSVHVACSSLPGCIPPTSCSASALFSEAFSRYGSRLSFGPYTPPAHPPAPTSTLLQRAVAQASRSGTYWWRLNNTNCNLHDMHDLACPSTHTIPQCQEVCDARADCGGFLYYSKTHSFALKNASCADDVAPLPAYDAGDDLFLLRTFAPPPLPLPPRSASPLSTVEVCVSDASEVLGPHTDESYSIVVNVSATAAAPPPRATVRAKTIFGAMHGLESLAQLVDVRVGHGAEVTIPRAPVTISDAPRFPFRGMMIDSGRHFLPLAHVRRVIDGAALLKLNAIHWHLVDSQSFPSCSVTFPELCEEGAYPNLESAKYEPSSPTRNVSKAKYALADLRDIVLFAKGRGVRIVPEWDVPGHGSWGFGKPELTTSYCKNALDPTNPAVYIFLKAFLLEMTEKAFVDDYLFLGGDELNTDCFDKSPAIAAWMKSHKLNASQTQQYFWQQMTANVFPALAANNKTISVWRADDPNRGPYAANLPPGSVANVYQSLSTAWKQTVPQGVATVVSMAGQKWYLDTMPGGGYYQNAWETVYNLDRGPNGSWLVDPSWGASERALFLGGETAMWGEGVNEDNWEAFVWRSGRGRTALGHGAKPRLPSSAVSGDHRRSTRAVVLDGIRQVDTIHLGRRHAAVRSAVPNVAPRPQAGADCTWVLPIRCGEWRKVERKGAQGREQRGHI